MVSGILRLDVFWMYSVVCLVNNASAAGKDESCLLEVHLDVVGCLLFRAVRDDGISSLKVLLVVFSEPFTSPLIVNACLALLVGVVMDEFLEI